MEGQSKGQRGPRGKIYPLLIPFFLLGTRGDLQPALILLNGLLEESCPAVKRVGFLIITHQCFAQELRSYFGRFGGRVAVEGVEAPPVQVQRRRQGQGQEQGQEQGRSKGSTLTAETTAEETEITEKAEAEAEAAEAEVVEVEAEGDAKAEGKAEAEAEAEAFHRPSLAEAFARSGFDSSTVVLVVANLFALGGWTFALDLTLSRHSRSLSSSPCQSHGDSHSHSQCQSSPHPHSRPHPCPCVVVHPGQPTARADVRGQLLASMGQEHPALYALLRQGGGGEVEQGDEKGGGERGGEGGGEGGEEGGEKGVGVGERHRQGQGQGWIQMPRQGDSLCFADYEQWLWPTLTRPLPLSLPLPLHLPHTLSMPLPLSLPLPQLRGPVVLMCVSPLLMPQMRTQTLLNPSVDSAQVFLTHAQMLRQAQRERDGQGQEQGQGQRVHVCGFVHDDVFCAAVSLHGGDVGEEDGGQGQGEQEGVSTSTPTPVDTAASTLYCISALTSPLPSVLVDLGSMTAVLSGRQLRRLMTVLQALAWGSQLNNSLQQHNNTQLGASGWQFLVICHGHERRLQAALQAAMGVAEPRYRQGRGQRQEQAQEQGQELEQGQGQKQGQEQQGQGQGRVLLVWGSVQHSRVLRGCVAALHHGGVGTVGACMLAGVPQVVLPVLYDQHANGLRVQEMKLGLVADCPELLHPDCDSDSDSDTDTDTDAGADADADADIDADAVNGRGADVGRGRGTYRGTGTSRGIDRGTDIELSLSLQRAVASLRSALAQASTPQQRFRCACVGRDRTKGAGGRGEGCSWVWVWRWGWRCGWWC
ncbi:hypothetical protein B484DRAFT_34863 [Ochromonadaceae sp. CCMP2298]|nr:hypothetical protein B484DRAFT_34863 [Ochromonadaceae sp. CCMP2298]